MTRHVGRKTLGWAAAILTIAAVVRFDVAVVGGGSMRPSIQPGDVLVYEGRSDAEPGDVVVFRSSGGSLVAHRVLRVLAHGLLVTRGDANPVPDRRCVEPENVEGVVRCVVPLGRVAHAIVQAGAAAGP